jgi:hypothetical protein
MPAAARTARSRRWGKRRDMAGTRGPWVALWLHLRAKAAMDAVKQWKYRP